MLKIEKITNPLSKEIPVSKNPVIQPLQREYMYVTRTEQETARKSQENLFSGLKKFFDVVTEKIDAMLTTPSKYTTATAEKTMTVTQAATYVKPATAKVETVDLNAQKLSKKKAEYNELYNEYIKLYGKRAEADFKIESVVTLEKLSELTVTITRKIKHEKTMQRLEEEFTHGTYFYLPKNKNGTPKQLPQITDLLEIIPDEKAPYKHELKRLCKIYICNMTKIDEALVYFKDVVRSFSDTSAASLKEIFDLKNDPKFKVLEKIPKLGVIPMALRVSEQIRLTNCIIKDHKNITNHILTNGMEPLIKKCCQQYKTIEQYINENKFKFALSKKYTNSFIEKIEDAKIQRLSADEKLLQVFGASGLNISNICKNVRKKGAFDLVRKTAVTMFSLF